MVNSKAVKNAKTTAASYLNPIGQKPGKVIFIGYDMLLGNTAGMYIRGASSIKSYSNKTYISPIEFEKIKISSEIGVRFAIE